MHAKPVTRANEVAISVNTAPLETWHLEHSGIGLGNAHVDQRLHLEAVLPLHSGRIDVISIGRTEGNRVQTTTTECSVSVARVRVGRPVEQADDLVQPVVPALAKSALCLNASTNRGISAGSVEPSASSITMKSRVAAAKPHANALPLPF